MPETVTQVVEYKGKLTFGTTKPDGVPRKLIDITRLESMGRKYNIDLESGLKKTFIWYLNEQLKG
jgi:GDP-L-fucose synthase